MKKKIFIILFLGASMQLYSQKTDSRFFHQYSEADGLCNNMVRDIVQDSSGYLWIGTENGISRFDGIRFQNYYNDSLHQGLIPKTIKNLIIDNTGNLWGAGERYIFYLNPDGVTFTNIDPFPEDSKAGIYFLYQYDDSTFIISNNKGLFYFDKNNLTIKKQVYHKSEKEDGFSLIVKDHGGNIWLSKWESLYQLKGGKKNKHVEKVNTFPFQIKNITSINLDDSNHIILTSVDYGIVRLNTRNFQCEEMVTKDQYFKRNPFSYSLKTNDGIIWVGSFGEYISIYNPEKKSLQRIMPDYSSRHSFVCYTSHCAFQSSDGSLWIGTRKGLAHYYKPKITTSLYSLENPNKFQRSYSNVTAIQPIDENNLLVGFQSDKVAVFNKETKTFQNVGNSYDVFDILPDDDNNCNWLIKSTCITKRTGNKEKDYCFLKFSDYLNRITAGFFDDKLIVSNRSNLFYYKQEVDSFIKLDIPLPIKEHYIYSPKESQHLWIYSMDTIFMLDKNFNILKKVKLNYSLNMYYVKPFSKSNQGIYFGGNNGFCKITPWETTFYKIDIAENTQVLNVIEKENTDLLLLTTSGLILFDSENGSYKLLHVNLFFHDSPFSTGSYSKDKKGRYYFASWKGLIETNLDDIIFDGYNTKINFSSFLLNNKNSESNYNSLLKEKKIYLKASDKLFTLTFSVNNYRGSVLYNYTINGLLDKEIKLNEPVIEIYSPPAGKYRLVINAINTFGESASETILLIIAPPVYLTLWFWIVVIIFILLIIWGYSQYKEYRLRKINKILNIKVLAQTAEITEKNNELQEQYEKIQNQNEEIEAQNEELISQNESIMLKQEELEKANRVKDRLFSIIAHDLKNPFNAIMGLTELVLKKWEEFPIEKIIELINIVKNSAEDAYRLFENLLNWSRSNLNKIRFTPSEIDIDKIIDENISLLSGMLKNKNILMKKVGAECIVFADKDMINTIVRNLISNAIKFTPDNGEIIIRYNINNNTFFLRVIDNGVGMLPNIKDNLFSEDEINSEKGTNGESGTGLGLILCLQFVELHQGTIRVESTLGKGSEFIVEFPFNSTLSQ